MLGAFLITFREGLEAFLLVGILLSYLRRMDAQQYNKYLYLGVGIGFLVSLLVAYSFQVLIDEFDNERYRHFLLSGILLFAVGVLTYMAIWMQKQARQQANQVQQNLALLITTGNLFGMVFLAFLAVLREGFETVLFLSALMYQQPFTLSSGLTGGVLGIVLSIVLVWVMLRGLRKVPLGKFFEYSGLLMLIIAGGLLASSVNMLQAVEVVPVLLAQPLFDISFVLDDRGTFGTFMRALFGYNDSPTLIQFATWCVFLTVTLTFWKRAYAK